jgi:hypothetical protein
VFFVDFSFSVNPLKLFACVLAVMAVVYTNSAPTEDEPVNTDEPVDQWQNLKEEMKGN